MKNTIKHIAAVAAILIVSTSFMGCESEEAKKQKEIEKRTKQMFHGLENHEEREFKGFVAPKIGESSSNDNQ